MSKNFYMENIGKKAKTASLHLSNIDIHKKNLVLKRFIQYLKKNSKLILNENNKDIFNAKLKKIKPTMIDRLELNNEKIEQIINSIKKIIKFKDPLKRTISAWRRPHGLLIKK